MESQSSAVSIIQGALGCALMIGFLALPFIVLGGAVWVGQQLLPVLFTVGWWIVAAAVFFLLPNLLIRKNISWAAPLLIASSYLLGGILWLWSLLITYWIWGWVGLIIGLIFAGVGVIPLALIAAALNGLWNIVVQLIMFTILVFAMRAIGFVRSQEITQENGIVERA